MVASPQKEHGYIAIANEIMEAFAKIRIAGEARQLLDFILRKTYGFNKKDDYISLSQFHLGTGLSKTHIIRAIHYLLNINIIFITKKGNKRMNLYKFNKDFSTWKPITKKGNAKIVTKKGNESLPKKGIAVTKKGNAIYTKDTLTKDTIQKTGNFSFLERPEPTAEEIADVHRQVEKFKEKCKGGMKCRKKR